MTRSSLARGLAPIVLLELHDEVPKNRNNSVWILSHYNLLCIICTLKTCLVYSVLVYSNVPVIRCGDSFVCTTSTKALLLSPSQSFRMAKWQTAFRTWRGVAGGGWFEQYSRERLLWGQQWLSLDKRNRSFIKADRNWVTGNEWFQRNCTF